MAIAVYSFQFRKKLVSVDCFDPAISFRQIVRESFSILSKSGRWAKISFSMQREKERRI